MTLYFQSSNDKRRELGKYTTKEDIYKKIKNFLNQHNYTSYYTRIWREGNEVWIDVGSCWGEFFIVEDEEGVWGEI